MNFLHSVGRLKGSFRDRSQKIEYSVGVVAAMLVAETTRFCEHSLQLNGARPSTNQPTNQPTDQSTNQPANQSASQSIVGRGFLLPLEIRTSTYIRRIALKKKFLKKGNRLPTLFAIATTAVAAIEWKGVGNEGRKESVRISDHEESIRNP
ncbi:hypothetical protein V1478_013881 [Vespula squamosa]|uniref:Uncharacterized protein n=1 Tax=Vespula squamosa TaxID=30214 RepID=A0ABD2A6J0_VESSQ